MVNRISIGMFNRAPRRRGRSDDMEIKSPVDVISGEQNDGGYKSLDIKTKARPKVFTFSSFHNSA